MKKRIRITEAEWEIMSVVWSQAPVAATAVVEGLARKKKWTLTTVRTLLRRLVDKGVVGQRMEGKRYVYEPQVSMDECVRRESESFLDRVLGRSPAAILHLVRNAEMTAEDIEELRRVLREKEEKQ